MYPIFQLHLTQRLQYWCRPYKHKAILKWHRDCQTPKSLSFYEGKLSYMSSAVFVFSLFGSKTSTSLLADIVRGFGTLRSSQLPCCYPCTVSTGEAYRWCQTFIHCCVHNERYWSKITMVGFSHFTETIPWSPRLSWEDLMRNTGIALRNSLSPVLITELKSFRCAEYRRVRV